MLENVRSALTRGLPELHWCPRHDGVLSVAAGGPSLDDTWPELTGRVCAVNGSLSFLKERGVMPYWCGVLDAGDHMADIVEADPNVGYFVASICDPSVFDHLKNCTVYLWHPTGMPLVEKYIQSHVDDYLMVGGGGTMGLRWLNLGYLLGYREFHLHGLDSSFRSGRTHAYPDRRDGEEHMTVNGFETRLNFLEQVNDFFLVRDRFEQPDMDETSITLYGDGLLQDKWRRAVEGRKDPEAYWKLGPGHITPQAKDWPEGEGFADFLRAYFAGDKIVELGCGTGRLSDCFDDYHGVDIADVSKAKEAHPDKVFSTLGPMPKGDVTLAHTVLMHVPDDRLAGVIASINTPRFVVIEVMGRRHRNLGLPPVFHRELTEYAAAFDGWDLTNIKELPYPHYRGEHLTLLEFSR